MKTCYYELSYDDFIARFGTIAGHDTDKCDLPNDKVAVAAGKLGAVLNGIDETSMYAPLVSFSDLNHEAGF
jgi:hypothetical protein